MRGIYSLISTLEPVQRPRVGVIYMIQFKSLKIRAESSEFVGGDLFETSEDCNTESCSI